MRDLEYTFFIVSFPFESGNNPTYPKRRAYLEEKVATGYSQEDVRLIAQLLRNNASDEVLAYEMVQIVNKRFFNGEIPAEITKIAKYTVQKFSEAIFPGKYIFSFITSSIATASSL